MTISVHASGDEKYIRLMYTTTGRNTGRQTFFEYNVGIVTTPCHFGGARCLFICPLSRNGVYCGRRVGALHRAPRADYYGCRHCDDLSALRLTTRSTKSNRVCHSTSPALGANR
jgi:hypothetical protein